MTTPGLDASLVPAVDRAFRMLGCFADRDDRWRISDLSRALGIAKSSAFRIATTLCHHGVLVCDAETRRYRLGPGLLRLAARAGVEHPLALLAQPLLDELADATEMAAFLGLFLGDEIVLAAKAEAPRPLGLSAPIGLRLAHCAGAFGKLLHASMPGATLREFLRHHPLRAFTARTITGAPAHLAEIERVRRRGYATDHEEYLEGVSAVGVHVRGADGRAIAGICVVGLTPALPAEREAGVAAHALDAAAALSVELGSADDRPKGGGGSERHGEDLGGGALSHSGTNDVATTRVWTRTTRKSTR